MNVERFAMNIQTINELKNVKLKSIADLHYTLIIDCRWSDDL